MPLFFPLVKWKFGSKKPPRGGHFGTVFGEGLKPGLKPKRQKRSVLVDKFIQQLIENTEKYTEELLSECVKIAKDKYEKLPADRRFQYDILAAGSGMPAYILLACALFMAAIVVTTKSLQAEPDAYFKIAENL